METTSEDLLHQLRELALVSRLRRLADLLWEDTAGLYEQLGLDFSPRWFVVFYAIADRSRSSISELAAAVGLSAQGVGKTVDELVAAGLVREVGDARDSRVRRVALSRRGRTLLGHLQPVWQGITEVARDLMAEADVDLLGDLDRIEAALGARSHGRRLRRHFGLPERRAVEIVDYRPAFKKHFRALNEQWLMDHFEVEAGDATVLADPNGRILKRGGHVLFALQRGEVVGTCALIRHASGELELAKMAVAPVHRRRGIGTALTVVAIERALDSGAVTVYLRTHPNLAAARHLYHKVGFRRITSSPLPPAEVRRDAITMRLHRGAYGRFRIGQEVPS
jgi:N-acetylglutamate synthase-like GNAT family acetyltransferase/DNA-binding MarR family transcriptional regulator